MKTGKYQIARSRVKKSDRQRRFNMFNWIILKKKQNKKLSQWREGTLQTIEGEPPDRVIHG